MLQTFRNLSNRPPLFVSFCVSNKSIEKGIMLVKINKADHYIKVLMMADT